MKLLIDTELFMPSEYTTLVHDLLMALRQHKLKHGNLPAGFSEVTKLGRKTKELYVSK
jgi:hypothetical protein